MLDQAFGVGAAIRAAGLYGVAGPYQQVQSSSRGPGGFNFDYARNARERFALYIGEAQLQSRMRRNQMEQGPLIDIILKEIESKANSQQVINEKIQGLYAKLSQPLPSQPQVEYTAGESVANLVGALTGQQGVMMATQAEATARRDQQFKEALANDQLQRQIIGQQLGREERNLDMTRGEQSQLEMLRLQQQGQLDAEARAQDARDFEWARGMAEKGADFDQRLALAEKEREWAREDAFFAKRVEVAVKQWYDSLPMSKREQAQAMLGIAERLMANGDFKGAFGFMREAGVPIDSELETMVIQAEQERKLAAMGANNLGYQGPTDAQVEAMFNQLSVAVQRGELTQEQASDMMKSFIRGNSPFSPAGGSQVVLRAQNQYAPPTMEYHQMATRAAQAAGIDPTLLMALVSVESNWNPNAKSSAGALGLGQLMPGTAQALGVDPKDPESNLRGAAKYLAQQIATFESLELALAAYNAGPGNVRKYNGIPPFEETQAYVRRVMSRYRELQQAGVAPASGGASLSGDIGRGVTGRNPLPPTRSAQQGVGQVDVPFGQRPIGYQAAVKRYQNIVETLPRGSAAEFQAKVTEAYNNMLSELYKELPDKQADELKYDIEDLKKALRDLAASVADIPLGHENRIRAQQTQRKMLADFEARWGFTPR